MKMYLGIEHHLVLILLCILQLNTMIFSQIQNIWQNRTSPIQLDALVLPHGIVSDNGNNVIQVGGARKDNVFNSILISVPSNQVQSYVAKYDLNGSLRWMRHTLSNYPNYAQDVVVGLGDDIYVSGYYSSSISFSSIVQLSNQLSNNIYGYIAKYDSSGNVLWADHFVPPRGGNCSVASIEPDLAGGLFVSGNFSLTSISNSIAPVYFEYRNVSYPTTFGTHLFQTHLDSAGNVIWMRITTSNFSGGSGIFNLNPTYTHVAPNGDQFICCRLLGNSSYSAILPDGSQIPYGGTNSKLVLLKFDYLGNLLWHKLFSGNGQASSFTVTTDSYYNVYISGRLLSGNINFDQITLSNPTVFSDGFVSKLDSSGNVLWGEKFYCKGTDYSLSIDGVDSVNIFYTGLVISDTVYYRNRIFLPNQVNYNTHNTFIMVLDTSGNVICQTVIDSTSPLQKNGNQILKARNTANLYLSSNIDRSGYLAKCHCGPDTLSATISGSHTICQGNGTQILLQFSGPGPYSVTYSDGFTPQTVTGITNRYYLAWVQPSVSSSYSITAFSGNQPSQSFSGQAMVQVNSLLGSRLSGPTHICTGQSATLTATLSGAPPWNLTWTDGTSSSTVSGLTQSPYYITQSPTVQTSYRISDLTGGCPGGQNLDTVTVTIVPLPSVSLSGNQTICPGQAAQLSFVLSGNPPYTLQYNDGQMTYTHTGITQSPWIYSVSPQTARTYTPVSVTTTCPGPISGQAIVDIHPALHVNLSGNQIACQGQIISFPVSANQTGSWSFSYSDGSQTYTHSGITSSTYLLTLTAQASATYTLTHSEWFGCPGTFAGSAVLTVPSSNAHLSGSQIICFGQTAVLTVSYPFTPWQLSYTDGLQSISLSGITSTSYQIQVSPQQNTTYTLTHAESPACLAQQLTGQALIQVNPLPTVALSGGQTLCQGQNANLSFSFTGGPPFTIQYSDGQQVITESGITANPYILPLLPQSSRTYTAISVNNSCAGSATGQALFPVIPGLSVQMGGTQAVCSGQSLQLPITSNQHGPWDFTYSDGVQTHTLSGITGTLYLLPVTATASATYQMIQSHWQGCSGNSSGSAVLTVQTAEATLSGSQSICAGSVATLMVTYPFTPWQLSYSNGTQVMQITGITSTSYTFGVQAQQSATYTLTQASSMACTAQLLSGQADVRVLPVPLISLSGSQTICKGGSVQITVSTTANPPWHFSLLEGNNQQSFSNLGGPQYILNYTPPADVHLTLTGGGDVCPAMLSPAHTQIGVLDLTASLSGQILQCAPQGLSFPVHFSHAGVWEVSYTDGVQNFTVTGITANPWILNASPQGNTTYRLLSAGQLHCPALLTDSLASVQVIGTPVVSMLQNALICIGDTAWLGIHHTGGQGSLWQVHYSDGIQTYTLTSLNGNPHIFGVSPLVNTTYTILSASYAGCAGNVSNGVGTVSIKPRPTASLTGCTQLYQGNVCQLTVSFTGNPPWAFTWSNGSGVSTETGITQNPYLLNVSPQSNSTYQLIDMGDIHCLGLTGGRVFVQVITDREDEKLSSGLSLFPNPSDGVINILWKGIGVLGEWQVWDYQGKMIQSGRAEDRELSIDLSKEADGVYLLSIRTESGVLQRKLRLEK